ncbi:MAG: hypothetical protein IKR34_05305 [Candidatus Gastranaerophilales bacterium]|nr:hypothetical protein [Candidatus Gastranaerophilales bacterium]
MTLKEKMDRLESYIENRFDENKDNDEACHFINGVEHTLYICYPHQRRKIRSRMKDLWEKYIPF